IDSTVQQVLSAKRGWWATIGTLIALWQVSAAGRGVMEVLESLYDDDEERSRLRKYATSIALALVAVLLLLGALICVQFGGKLVGGPFGAILRWLVALALLTVLIALLDR